MQMLPKHRIRVNRSMVPIKHCPKRRPDKTSLLELSSPEPTNIREQNRNPEPLCPPSQVRNSRHTRLEQISVKESVHEAFLDRTNDETSPGTRFASLDFKLSGWSLRPIYLVFEPFNKSRIVRNAQARSWARLKAP
jgi:hypothetical protein